MYMALQRNKNDVPVFVKISIFIPYACELTIVDLPETREMVNKIR